MIELSPIADGVFVARTQPLDVNATVVVGGETALVVDALSTEAQAHELLAAVRVLTQLPLTVLVTHFHFDHAFGAGILAAGGRPVWGHPYTATELGGRSHVWKKQWQEEWAAAEPELAAGLVAVVIRPPDRLVPEAVSLDLGGRAVEVMHPGRGHTAGDLVAYVPDVDVLVAGDLVEQGNPPDFTDAYPLEWPETVGRLLETVTTATLVVPGHGSLVDGEFMEAQHAELADLDWLIRDAHADRGTVDEAATRGPFPEATNRVAVRRGFAALDGH